MHQVDPAAGSIERAGPFIQRSNVAFERSTVPVIRSTVFIDRSMVVVDGSMRGVDGFSDVPDCLIAAFARCGAPLGAGNGRVGNEERGIRICAKLAKTPRAPRNTS